MRSVLLISVIVIIGGIITFTGNVIKRSYVFQVANGFLFTPDSTVESFDGRTNILLLGKADGDLNTPDLTDTMIFASVKTTEPRQVTLVSVPRDIWVPEMKDKINASYRNGGLVLAKSYVEEVVGQPIHYAIAIDSSNLVEVIDILGGIVVEVERSFTDHKFPIPGLENDECGGDPPSSEAGPEYKCRYETVTFTQGLTKMDGVTALKYSRSRHAEEGEERTDFARAARQQKVIDAIRTKVMNVDTLTSYTKMRALYSVARKSVETDLTDPQIAYLARRFSQSSKNINQHVLSQELFTMPELVEEYNFLYVLVPRTGNWDEVHKWVEELL